jgi:transcriptional regulator with XRE-family HTH domain
MSQYYCYFEKGDYQMAKTSPFGQWLKKWRLARKLTQVELARKADCGQSIISQHERGVRQEVGGDFIRPEPDLVERLATALDRPVEEARALAGYLPSPAPVTMKDVGQVMESLPAIGYYNRENPQGVSISPALMQEFIQAVKKLTELSKTTGE